MTARGVESIVCGLKSPELGGGRTDIMKTIATGGAASAILIQERAESDHGEEDFAIAAATTTSSRWKRQAAAATSTIEEVMSLKDREIE